MTTRAQLAELDAVIAELKAHPERHEQGAWFLFNGETPPVVTPALDCGSAFCIAGAVVARAGAQPEWRQEDWWDDNDVRHERWAAQYVTTVEGDVRYIESYAAKLLGLGFDTQDRLFYAYNTMDDIMRLRDEIAAAVTD